MAVLAFIDRLPRWMRIVIYGRKGVREEDMLATLEASLDLIEACKAKRTTA